MVVEAKPPVRRKTGAWGILVVVGALALFVPLVLIGGALLFSILFVRTEAHYVPPAQPVVYSYTTSATSDYSMGAGMASASHPEFEARISAAQQIQDTTQRDEAFQILASKLSGNAYEAGQAIQQIQDTDGRQIAAWDAAKRFGEQGQSQEALSLVNQMTDQKMRDAALRAIATGEWPERPGAASGTTTEKTEDAAEEALDTTTETAVEASSF